ncbi:MAG: lytic murein transglycosylase [Desulfovibrionaceae bacterium]|nr:lytic murein transglycosylase [Desulfovibrionaceae bacterium]
MLLKDKFLALVAIFIAVFLLETQAVAVDSKPKVLPAPWQYLADRLVREKVWDAAMEELLFMLPAKPTQSPMGRKMRDLYKKQFFPRPKIKPTDYYKGVVTKDNAEKCAAYVKMHRQAFAAAQQKYAVPPEIAVALLFVETRLGKVLADIPEDAFYTLASMAVSREPKDISSWLPKMPGVNKRLKWVAKTMVGRAEWAYKEFKALIIYMVANRIYPKDLPGSIYGAVGLCQFMPSNISIYGADGNHDGRIDLFNIDDAAMSLAKYLAKHGWREGIDRDTQHALLMKYNHSKVYANTILALSDLIVLERGNGEQPDVSPR